MPISASRIAIRVRSSAPAFLRRWIDGALAAERGPIAWAKDVLLVHGELPPVAEPRTDLGVRLLIAPLNYAGQGREWARTASSDAVEAVNLGVVVDGSFGAPSDWTVSAEVFTASRRWRADQRAAVTRFSHVMIESFASPFGRGTGAVVLDDVVWLRERGVHVALICHGTDIRHPQRHVNMHPHSPFAEVGPGALAAAVRSADANSAVLRGFDGPVFVSTPDLLADAPGSRWLPVVVDPARWASTHPVDATVPIVVHIPSAGHVKGTEHVDRAAQRLQDAGVLRYVRMQNVPAAAMPGHVGQADVVVDQLLLGGYGVAACEALAAGRVVVGNVDDHVRAHVRAETGLDVPIVQADPDTLDEVLRVLAADPERRRAVAAKGPDFVRQVHSGALTSQVLGGFLGAAMQ
ncbi:hypothetical protein [Microbacterium sp. NPDC056234]|uniref:hypothetical protein n=1 Tax=Microbacterium sp. NPDC056234 TaxID=3345757 RepID=UPI0035D7A8EB